MLTDLPASFATSATFEELLVKRINFMQTASPEDLKVIDMLLDIKKQERDAEIKERDAGIKEREADIKKRDRENELEVKKRDREHKLSMDRERKTEGLSTVTGEDHELTHTTHRHTHSHFFLSCFYSTSCFPPQQHERRRR